MLFRLLRKCIAFERLRMAAVSVTSKQMAVGSMRNELICWCTNLRNASSAERRSGQI